MSKIHCFYHSADLDGHCSGAIVKYRYPDAVMHPINYGQEFPWDEIKTGDTIFMTDFCLQPFDQMVRLASSGVALFWIDHHSSAIKEYHIAEKTFRADPGVLINGMWDTSKAACELTWEYLFPDKPVPLTVKLLSLYDSWTYQGHELEPMVLPFQMRMRMERLDPKSWEECSPKWRHLFGDPDPKTPKWFAVGDLISDGELILRYDEEQKRRYVQTYGFETQIFTPQYLENPFSEGAAVYKAIAVNLGHTNSKVFDSVWRQNCSCVDDEGLPLGCELCEGAGYLEPYDLMITFCRRSDRKWNVSLYSTKPSIDCGAIAKTFGGGGHKGAAGFQCSELPFTY